MLPSIIVVLQRNPKWWFYPQDPINLKGDLLQKTSNYLFEVSDTMSSKVALSWPVFPKLNLAQKFLPWGKTKAFYLSLRVLWENHWWSFTLQNSKFTFLHSVTSQQSPCKFRILYCFNVVLNGYSCKIPFQDCMLLSRDTIEIIFIRIQKRRAWLKFHCNLKRNFHQEGSHRR